MDRDYKIVHRKDLFRIRRWIGQKFFAPFSPQEGINPIPLGCFPLRKSRLPKQGLTEGTERENACDLGIIYIPFIEKLGTRRLRAYTMVQTTGVYISYSCHLQTALKTAHIISCLYEIPHSFSFAWKKYLLQTTTHTMVFCVVYKGFIDCLLYSRQFYSLSLFSLIHVIKNLTWQKLQTADVTYCTYPYFMHACTRSRMAWNRRVSRVSCRPYSYMHILHICTHTEYARTHAGIIKANQLISMMERKWFHAA